MAVELKRWRFTVDEYHRMGEAGVLGEDDRVELIDGEILEMSPIGPGHSGGINRLTYLFVGRVGDRAVVSVQNPVILNDYEEPQPDLMLLRPRSDFYRSATATPADVLLLIEVADSSVDYDRQVKAPLYARNGIPEYWMLNLLRDQVVVYREPIEDGYRSTQVFRRGETISPLAFPDLQITVEELLG
jgi:Uma2 family endonuclease